MVTLFGNLYIRKCTGIKWIWVRTSEEKKLYTELNMNLHKKEGRHTILRLFSEKMKKTLFECTQSYIPRGAHNEHCLLRKPVDVLRLVLRRILTESFVKQTTLFDVGGKCIEKIQPWLSNSIIHFDVQPGHPGRVVLVSDLPSCAWRPWPLQLCYWVCLVSFWAASVPWDQETGTGWEVEFGKLYVLCSYLCLLSPCTRLK